MESTANNITSNNSNINNNSVDLNGKTLIKEFEDKWAEIDKKTASNNPKILAKNRFVVQNYNNTLPTEDIFSALNDATKSKYHNWFLNKSKESNDFENFVKNKKKELNNILKTSHSPIINKKKSKLDIIKINKKPKKNTFLVSEAKIRIPATFKSSLSRYKNNSQSKDRKNHYSSSKEKEQKIYLDKLITRNERFNFNMNDNSFLYNSPTSILERTMDQMTLTNSSKNLFESYRKTSKLINSLSSSNYNAKTNLNTLQKTTSISTASTKSKIMPSSRCSYRKLYFNSCRQIKSPKLKKVLSLISN